MDDPTLDRNLMLAQIGELTLRLGAMAEHLRVALEQRDQAAADATEARRQLAAAKPAPRSRPKR